MTIPAMPARGEDWLPWGTAIDPVVRRALPKPLFTPGAYYSTLSGNSAGTSHGNGSIFACPLWVDAPRTFDRIAIDILNAAAGITCRLLVYGDNGFGKPGPRLLDAGTVDGTTSGTKEITINFAAPAGLLWLATNLIGSVTGQYRTHVGHGGFPMPPTAPGAGGAFSNGYYGSNGGESSPATFPGSNLLSSIPMVWLRAA